MPETTAQSEVRQAGVTQQVELRPYRPPYTTQSAVGTPVLTSPSADETVTVTLDGVERTVPKGQLIITAADEAGVYIPRFCYHPRMKPVGMCRMCLVEVVGPRGATLMPACYNPVADGIEIKTTSEMTKKAQDGVLEFLLVNHPLDCPVCDKGGECPLQDQTLAYGPGESRFVEEKRHWDKPIALSELVSLDRERCIQCGRCVRFADEVAGDPLIDFADRGDSTEVATFPDEPYASYFSGNVVQICPVGALTASPYRFRARPWDLEQVESTCTSCAVGCRAAVQSSSDELTRYIGIDSDPVNWGWLCDKGRFDFEAVNSPDRLTVPLVRRGDELVEVGWAEALSVAAAGLSAAVAAGDGKVGVIGGARLPNEDAYVWAKVARLALRTDNVDAQLADGLPAEVVLGLPRATIDEAAAADVVITLTGDIKDELPVLFLRLRDAAQQGRALVELSPVATGMTRYCTASLRYRPGHAAELVRSVLAGDVPEVGALLGLGGAAEGRTPEAEGRVPEAEGRVPEAEGRVPEAEGRVPEAEGKGRGGPSVVVVLGRPSLAEGPASLVEAARLLAGIDGVRFLSGLRRANVHGALDMGLAPGTLPGRVGLDEGRAWYERQWGATLPEGPGLDTARMLAAAAEGRVSALVLVGADPVTDVPDRALALQAVQRADFVVAVDTFLTPSSRRADVILPAATYAERRGTTTNIEGRVSWLGQMVTPPGVAWPDWMIASELAAGLGVDLGLSTVEGIWEEITRVSSLHAGVTHDVLVGPEGRNGVLVPLGSGPAAHRPRRLDPMADPGIGTVEAHSTPAFAPTATGAVGPATTAGADEAGRPGLLSLAPLDAPAASPAPGAPHAAANDGPAPVELTLVSGRTLWDGGTAVAHSRSLVSLHPAPAIRLHPSDLDRVGVGAGDTVVVRNPRGELQVPARPDPGVAPGTAAVSFNLPGVRIGDLVDATAASTLVTVAAMAVATPGAGSAAGADDPTGVPHDR